MLVPPLTPTSLRIANIVQLAAVPVFAFVVLALWNVAVAWLQPYPSEDVVKTPAAEPTP